MHEGHFRKAEETQAAHFLGQTVSADNVSVKERTVTLEDVRFSYDRSKAQPINALRFE